MSNELYYPVFTPIVILLFGCAAYAEHNFQKLKTKVDNNDTL